jgi:hypothetical protein
MAKTQKEANNDSEIWPVCMFLETVTGHKKK